MTAHYEMMAEFGVPMAQEDREAAAGLDGEVSHPGRPRRRGEAGRFWSLRAALSTRPIEEMRWLRCALR